MAWLPAGWCIDLGSDRAGVAFLFQDFCQLGVAQSACDFDGARFQIEIQNRISIGGTNDLFDSSHAMTAAHIGYIELAHDSLRFSVQ